MDQNRNLFVAVALSALFMLGWWKFFAEPQQLKAEQQHKAQIAAQQKQAPKPAEAPGAIPVPGSAPAAAAGSTAIPHLPRAEALARGGQRIAIKTPLIDGSLRLTGARFDDLKLKNYHATVDPKSPEIELLSPFGSDYPYFVQFEWRSEDTKLALPGHQTPWQLAKGDVLAPGKPVVLTWNNGQGLTFTRTIAIDDQYMFTVTDKVTSTADKPVKLMPYTRVQRLGVPHSKTDFTTYLLHEGFVGVAQSKLQEAKYGDFDKKDFAPQNFTSKGGWLAITDKYWMAAIVPPQGETFAGRYHMAWYGPVRSFLADYNLAPRTLAPGASLSVTQNMFGGAKVVGTLRHYEKTQNVEMFDYATDWGWFWMFTRPLFWVLDNIFKLVGNFGLAIILATIVLRLLLYPMANHQFKSMGKMKKLQPQMEAIKKKYADDQQRQQQEMMELFKREKANPVAGCLPMLIQFPILFAFYKVQVVTIEMFHAPFWGWIKDLSAPDPTTYANLFGLLPYTVPADIPYVGFLLHVGLWPILMGITQWVQMKMNPAATDPVQQKMFALMPLIFTFMFAAFPAGLVIYYTWNNILSMAQQGYMMKKEGVEIHLFKNLAPPQWLRERFGFGKSDT
jgi:YidC/Oxa1 family membrane protein insertase